MESKSPSRGLSGLVMLFLFDGECFNAETQIIVELEIFFPARDCNTKRIDIDVLMEIGTINWKNFRSMPIERDQTS